MSAQSTSRKAWLRWTLITSLSISALAPRLAVAQDAHRASAEAHFREGRRLMREGKLDKACPALAASQRLDPATGTLLNLARCYELSGKIASAWAAYAEAEATSLREGNDDRASAAGHLREAIAPRVVRVRLCPSESSTSATLMIDGRVLLPEEWGLSHPLDPGPHEAVLQDGGQTIRKIFEVPLTPEGQRAQQLDISIQLEDADVAPLQTESEAPSEEDQPKPKPLPPSPSNRTEATNTARIVGFGLVGAGLLTTSVSAFFVADAFSDADDADCDENLQCSPAGQSDRKTASKQLTISYVTGGLGVALGVAGALLLIRPKQKRTTARLRFDADVHQRGLELKLGGTF